MEEEGRILAKINITIAVHEDATSIDAYIKIKSTNENDFIEIQKTLISLLRANPDFYNVINTAVGAFNDILINQPDILEDIDETIRNNSKKINFNHK